VVLPSVETRHYISSLPNSAERFANAIRGHWGVENQVHWVLDVVFAADDSRVRIGHSAHNLAIIRHLVLNMLRQEASLKTSLRQKRLRAAWDNAYLLKVLQINPQGTYVMRKPWVLDGALCPGSCAGGKDPWYTPSQRRMCRS